MLDPSQEEHRHQIEQDFHALYYNDFENTWETTTFMGVKVLKNPCDLWIYHELIWKIQPDLIIETGTAHGGSALYLAHQLDLLGKGTVVTIDIHGLSLYPNRPPHPRIRYVKGSSANAALINSLFGFISSDHKVLVILDSDHRREHVFMELKLFAPFVTLGSYLIVEDSNINGRPVAPKHGPGPAEALEAWLPQHPEFVPDQTCERLHLTFNPGGYLLRIPNGTSEMSGGAT